MDALTPEQLLNAYANGYFPMALNRDDPELYWFSPEERGVLPLERFNIPRGLARAMKKHAYTITVDTAFEQVIRACGTVTPERDETWINENIVQLYTTLFEAGHAHSVEVWQEVVSRESSVVSDGRSHFTSPLAGEATRLSERSEFSRSGEGAVKHDSPTVTAPSSNPLTQGERASHTSTPAPNEGRVLIGGLYGVSLGGAFFGESMFSRAADASKMALVRLVEILRAADYELLDTQYVNEHLKQFGVEAWSKEHYMMKLEKALIASPNPSMRFSTASVRSGAASSSSLSEV